MYLYLLGVYHTILYSNYTLHRNDKFSKRSHDYSASLGVIKKLIFILM